MNLDLNSTRIKLNPEEAAQIFPLRSHIGVTGLLQVILVYKGHSSKSSFAMTMSDLCVTLIFE
jgi:hypothetical protein